MAGGRLSLQTNRGVVEFEHWHGHSIKIGGGLFLMWARPQAAGALNIPTRIHDVRRLRLVSSTPPRPPCSPVCQNHLERPPD
jgi:hypothetical protein